MSHVFQVPDDIYAEVVTCAALHGQTPDVFFITLLKEGMESLKQKKATTQTNEATSGKVHDPLAPFVGTLDSVGEDFAWMEEWHDDYFAQG